MRLTCALGRRCRGGRGGRGLLLLPCPQGGHVLEPAPSSVGAATAGAAGDILQSRIIVLDNFAIDNFHHVVF